jgi:hypothetical protein
MFSFSALCQNFGTQCLHELNYSIILILFINVILRLVSDHGPQFQRLVIYEEE